jgi:hypothetical protein
MGELLGQLVGGLIPTFLISRLILWALSRWRGGFAKLSLAHLVSGAICWILATVGYANGGPLDWTVGAFLLTPQLAWFCFDVWRGDPLEDDLEDTIT